MNAGVNTYRIINVMRMAKADQVVDLEEVKRRFATATKLYRGRLEMIVMRMSNGRNVQMFRGGRIQILGKLSHDIAQEMMNEFLHRLRMVKKMENVRVTSLQIRNMVVSFHLKTDICLQKIAESDSKLSYDVELFPAALLRKWHPVHIAVFHNGKVIITGLKSLSHVNEILNSLQHFLRESHLYAE